MGGQERVALRTAQILKNDYNITLLAFEKSEKEYQHDNLDIIYMNMPKITNKFNYLLRITTILRKIHFIKRTKKEKKIDISLSFGDFTNIYNSIAKVNEKCVTSIRGYESFYHNEAIAKKYHNKADITISVSKGIADKVEQLYGLTKEKLKILYNPFDIAEIASKSCEKVDDYDFIDTVTIVTVGRLAEIKGYEHLIRAFSIVKETIKNSKLLILGEGVCQERLDKMIKELRLEDSITLLGHRENPYKYVAKSSLYVLSSENEGFPNALVEGMCLVPVVSVDCKSGPREILSDGDYKKTAKDVELADYGILTPPVTKSRNYSGDAIETCDEKLAEAIIKILTDNELYNHYKTKAQERAKHFSYEAYRENIINILEG